MESSFTWLDNSDRDRQRAQEALRLFLAEEIGAEDLEQSKDLFRMNLEPPRPAKK